MLKLKLLNSKIMRGSLAPQCMLVKNVNKFFKWSTTVFKKHEFVKYNYKLLNTKMHLSLFKENKK
jgi:hypothetical protein